MTAAFCIGIVWGWLMASTCAGGQTARTTALLAAAMLLQAAEIVWMIAPAALWLFAAGWLSGFLLKRAARHALARRIEGRVHS